MNPAIARPTALAREQAAAARLLLHLRARRDQAAPETRIGYVLLIDVLEFQMAALAATVVPAPPAAPPAPAPDPRILAQCRRQVRRTVAQIGRAERRERQPERAGTVAPVSQGQRGRSPTA